MSGRDSVTAVAPSPTGESPEHPLQVTGEVTDNNGRPVVGASVVVLDEDYLPPIPRKARNPQRRVSATDTNGRFHIEMKLSKDKMLRGNLRLVVTAKGHALLWRDVSVAELWRPVQLRLYPQESLHGRLLGPKGDPAAGVNVEVLSLSKSPTWASGNYFDLNKMSIVMEGKSGADGRFQIDGIPSGVTVTCSARSADIASTLFLVQMDKTRKSMTGLYLECANGSEIRFEAGVQVSGKIEFAETNRPAIAARVTLMGFGLRTATTDSMGRFQFDRVKSGKWRLDAHPPAATDHTARASGN